MRGSTSNRSAIPRVNVAGVALIALGFFVIGRFFSGRENLRA